MSTVQKNCEACGALITVRLADHKRGWGRFCDKACAAAHKCGQRPRDVNAHHAKKSIWAHFSMQKLDAAGGSHAKAPAIKEQVGHRVKVKPLYHSPSFCRKCGEPAGTQGEWLCDACDMHEQAMADSEAGWDGHKGLWG